MRALALLLVFATLGWLLHVAGLDLALRDLIFERLSTGQRIIGVGCLLVALGALLMFPSRRG